MREGGDREEGEEGGAGESTDGAEVMAVPTLEAAAEGRNGRGQGSGEAETTGREGDREDEEEGGTGEGNDGAEKQYEEQKLEQVREDMTNILEKVHARRNGAQ